jgi:hypothetical protein
MTERGIVGLMFFEAATLVVAAALHLTRILDDGNAPFRPDRAGIAESIIAAVLIAGAFALSRDEQSAALAAVVFAIAGFGIGLSMTIRGGATGDITYHATMLPILLVTLILLVRTRRATA